MKTKKLTIVEKVLMNLKDKTAIEANTLHSKVFKGVRGELRARLSDIRKRGLANIETATTYKGKFYYIRDDKGVLSPKQKAQVVKKASYSAFTRRMFGWCL